MRKNGGQGHAHRMAGSTWFANVPEPETGNHPALIENNRESESAQARSLGTETK
jgi:hypothetical protein